MNRTWQSSFVLGALLLAVPVYGGIGAKNGEFGMDVGYTNVDPEVFGSDGFNMGFRGGYFFSKTFELECQLAVIFMNDHPVSAVIGSAIVNAVVNFHPSQTVVPYILAGYGVAHLEYSESDPVLDFSVGDTGPAYQFGVGSRFFLGKTKKTAIRLELLSLTEQTFDESSRHTSFQIGVTWRIGEPPKGASQD